MIVEKISRLTPDQQREIEDFIDFLITRDSNATQGVHNHESSGNNSGIRDNETQPASMIFAEDRSMAGRSDQDILPEYPEYGAPETIGRTREPERRIVIPRRNERETGKLLDWID
ncbi:MAG: hypothetical protein NTV68_10385 [Methanomicrobiales archaeon]|nr:hypothetical protein [Methanomicrobiales archaeon]